MKKVIGLFITVVIIAIFGAMALGEEVFIGSRDETFRILNEWTESNGIEQYTIYSENGEDACWTGVFSLSEAEFEFGLYDSINDLFELWKTKVFEETGVMIKIDLVGSTKGTNVYQVEGTNKDNGNHELIYFMIYNDVNE